MSCSREKRRKGFKAGPASKTLKKQKEKLLKDRVARLRARKEPTSVKRKTYRNDPCPCGSGKKFKNCSCYNKEDTVT